MSYAAKVSLDAERLAQPDGPHEPSKLEQDTGGEDDADSEPENYPPRKVVLPCVLACCLAVFLTALVCVLPFTT